MSYQLSLQYLFNILNACTEESISVNNDDRTFTAMIHAAGSPEHHLVIQVILPEVLLYYLNRLPVTSGKTGTSKADLYAMRLSQESDILLHAISKVQ